MDPTTLGSLAVILALIFIFLRVPIAFALGAVGLIGLWIFFSFRPGADFNPNGYIPALTTATQSYFTLFHSYDLSAVPLFVAMGHICYRSGITSDIYDAARTWISWIPGGLAIASVMGCGGFAAISGSSLACAATMGRVAVPEMTRSGYSERLASASVAAGGTLGALIPPSILFILYGVFAEQSVGKLFIAGIVPGIISLLGYILVITIWAMVRKQDAPRFVLKQSSREKLRVTLRTWPALLIFTIIIGGIYGGFFTPTEAGAVVFALAVVISLAMRRIDGRGVAEALKETAFQTAALFLIGGGAAVFSSLVALTGLTRSLVELVSYMDLSQAGVLVAVVLVYLLLGMFLDPLGILLLTLPFSVPLVEQHGVDLIWFGVLVVKLLEMGLITPPVGMNVFVISSVTKPPIPAGRIFSGVVPFFAMDVVVVALLIAAPGIALWLT
ncbi:C4-dicarboxylate ABC transporter permease [Oceanicola sp. 22II-s10i]|uniref:TRAP transporter large permease n=1 Tax=Oceanicola sp. 22II-s10i TaxID=1317116 RepID=UPI000B521E84|nr:TRAP transporter large permease [Oceanicola sp. 22II-s10i]OWU83113.1 C4-dicarboxylate ABC transporter permease [Oceanicola sp. 22II-s10i]